jgi:outer membrane protein assembly factor BamD (BamD/ComL family)
MHPVPRFDVLLFKQEENSMMHRLGFFLVVFMGLAAMAGYAFQEPPRSHEDPTKKAEKEIMDLIQQYPDSDYASALREPLKDVQEVIALKNFAIAKYYANRANNAGAISRLKTIIENYPNFSRIVEVKQLYESLAPAKKPSQSPGEDAK